MGSDVGRRMLRAARGGKEPHLSCQRSHWMRALTGLLLWLVHLVVGANALQLSRPVGPT